MTRTDLHRPSAIVPEEYEFVACDYYGSGLDALSFTGDRMFFREHMKRTGGSFSRHEHGGTCGVCGAGAMYVARYHHRPTNTYITTGMDCAAKMDIADEVAFRNFKKRIAAGRKTQRGLAKAEGVLAEAGLPAAWTLYRAEDRSAFRKQEEIVTDIVGKLVRYGSISDPQMGLIRKLLGDIEQRPARDAAVAAKRAEQAATSRHVGTVGQRMTLSLTVGRVFKGEGHYGPYVILNCTDSDGNVVVYKGSADLGVEAGDAITMTATVKKHTEWQGIAQTEVSRPKVAAQPAPVVDQTAGDPDAYGPNDDGTRTLAERTAEVRPSLVEMAKAFDK